MLTLLGDVDQVPDLARSALALIFRIVPVATCELARAPSSRSDQVMGVAEWCMGKAQRLTGSGLL